MLPFLFPTNSISTLALARHSRSNLDRPEQIMMVPLRSVVTLSVNIMEINGKDELSFNDLETFRLVKAVNIGRSIRIVPI